MENNVIQLVRKPTLSTRLKQAGVIAAGTALAIHANAASSIDATGLTDEISGAQTTIISLFGAGLVLLGIFAGWRYLKRGANSA